MAASKTTQLQTSVLVKKYNKCLEEKIMRHRLIERTGRVYTSGLPGEEMKKQLDRIDAESKQYMKYAKKKCQRIKSGRIPFSLSKMDPMSAGILLPAGFSTK